MALKQANAELLGSLIERFQQKYSLKVGYAEYLLQSMMEKGDVGSEGHQQQAAPLCIYGCLLCLLQFGPHITKMIMLHESSYGGSDGQATQLSTSNLRLLAKQLRSRLEIGDASEVAQGDTQRMEID